MTVRLGPHTRLWPESVRLSPLDGARPDVLSDLEEYVVDWQVSDRHVSVGASREAVPAELFFP